MSTTNWEKGRIVAEWREALIEAAAPAAAYTDEAWSRRVGSVTPQHTGRLRRVYQRFASMREAYRGLYWSHFQAALDWDDAEMWLEGAVQNRWSISQMQGERSRTLGVPVEESVEATAVEVDEEPPRPKICRRRAGPASRPKAYETADAETDEADASETAGESVSLDAADSYAGDEIPPLRPFENLPYLASRSARSLRRLQAGDHPPSDFQLAGSPPSGRFGHLGGLAAVGPGAGRGGVAN